MQVSHSSELTVLTLAEALSANCVSSSDDSAITSSTFTSSTFYNVTTQHSTCTMHLILLRFGGCFLAEPGLAGSTLVFFFHRFQKRPLMISGTDTTEVREILILLILLPFNGSFFPGESGSAAFHWVLLFHLLQKRTSLD